MDVQLYLHRHVVEKSIAKLNLFPSQDGKYIPQSHNPHYKGAVFKTINTQDATLLQEWIDLTQELFLWSDP